MSNNVDLLLAGMSEEHLGNVGAGTKDASGEGRAEKLEISGRYIMVGETVAYFGKENNAVIYPEMRKAESTGTIQIALRLAVVEPTDQVRVGSHTFINVPLIAAPKADNESDEDYKKRVANTQSMCKQYLCALLGTNDIRVPDKAWMIENLLPEFKQEDNKLIMVRDHKMKNRVYVTLEDDIYQNKPTLKVKSVIAAKPGDKSISNTAKIETAGNADLNKKADPIDVGTSAVVPEDAEAAGMGFSTAFPGASTQI